VATDTDGDKVVVDAGASVTIENDVPTFHSVMDAILSSAARVAFDGHYSATFGADGVDYLSAALGASGYVGTTAVTYQQTPYSSDITQVNVMNGSTLMFSFYYTTTTSPVHSGGDGSVLINAFGDPDDIAGTEFFTLDVKADGTYSFDMISNEILSTTETTVGGGDFTASGPSGEKSLLDGSLTIYGGDVDSYENVNAAANGVGVGQPTISEGEWLLLDFLNLQEAISFQMVQWGGGGDVHIRVTVDGAQFDFGAAAGFQDLVFARPDVNPTMAVVVADAGHPVGTWGYDATTHTYTLYVDHQFDNVKVENVVTSDGNLQFGLNTFTFDQVTTTTVEDMTVNFHLAVTDGDGDTSSLADPLTIAMVDPSHTIDATTIDMGVDGNDGVVLVGNGENDILVGGAGHDILIGNAGSDTLTGGDGNVSDTFVFQRGDVGHGVDTITDFTEGTPASGGDVLDISDLLAGAGIAPASNPADYLVVTSSGTSTTVAFDATVGDHTDAVQIATLQNVNTTLETLIANQQIHTT
jgi:soluble P-type ATPase